MPDLPRLALSIRQPWAWAIVHAGKDIENRSWETLHRGPICIHASASMTRAEYAAANEVIQANLGAVDQAWLDRWHGVTAAPAKLQFGGIIGVAEIVNSVRHHDSPWFFGKFGFVLANVRPVDFIPVKGLLGLFDWRKNLSPDR